MTKSKSNRTIGRTEIGRLVGVVEDARIGAGITQRELSRRLGMHEMTMMRFANGERMIDVVEFIDVAVALGRDPVELLRAALAA